MNTINNRAAINNPVTQPVIQMRMNSVRDCTTLSRAERAEFSVSPDIKHDSRYLLVNGENKINDPYATEAEKQRYQNERDGHGDVTNVEYFREVESRCFYYEAEEEEDYWYDFYEPDEEYQYLMENGVMVDDGMSCRMTLPENIGASFEGTIMDIGDEPEPDAELEAEGPDALDGTPQEATSDDPEEEIAADGTKIKKGQDAESKADAKATAKAANKSGNDIDDPAIETKIDLCKNFTNACSAKPSEPEPEIGVEQQFAVAKPANVPAFQQSA